MCVQRTYHRAARGKRETKEMPIRISCGNSCIVENQWRHATGMAKTMAKIATGALQHPARRHQRPSKIKAEASMRAQMRPRVFKNRAKGAQETSKSLQKLPKSGPSAAKTRPRQAREATRPLRKRTRQAPRRILATIVIGSLLRQGAGTFFHDLWHCVRCLRSVLRPAKTVVLSHSEHFDHASAHARKNDANKALEHPQVLPKPSQIHRKSQKIVKNRLKKPR